MVAHEVDSGNELRQAFQRVVLALDGDHHRVRRRQRIHGEKAERRRAIQQDVVVLGYQVCEDSGQSAFALRQRCQFDLSPSQRDRRGNDGEAWDIGRHDQIGDVRIFDDRFIDGVLYLATLKAEAAGGVALRIEVDDENCVAGQGQIRGQVDYGRGLADATLLVGAGDDLTHSGPHFGRRHVQILAFWAVFRASGLL